MRTLFAGLVLLLAIAAPSAPATPASESTVVACTGAEDRVQCAWDETVGDITSCPSVFVLLGQNGAQTFLDGCLP